MSKARVHYYLSDGREIDEAEAIDERGLIRDGVRLHIPMEMRDSAGNFLVDGLGNPLPVAGRRSGFVFADNRSSDHAQRYAEMRDWQKAELSNRWRGGLQEGDAFHLGDRYMEVTGRDPNNNKIVLSDASQLNADEIKKAAYMDYERSLGDAWKTRDALPGEGCVTGEGEHGKWTRSESGGLVCKAHSEATPGRSEWDLAGPLSDSQMEAVKDAAREQYEDDLRNAWRR